MCVSARSPTPPRTPVAPIQDLQRAVLGARKLGGPSEHRRNHAARSSGSEAWAPPPPVLQGHRGPHQAFEKWLAAA